MGANTHVCFAAGCKLSTSNQYLMCHRHWHKVPYRISRVIWKTVGKPEVRPLYLEAVAEAILAVGTIEGYSEDYILADTAKKHVHIERHGLGNAVQEPSALGLEMPEDYK